MKPIPPLPWLSILLLLSLVLPCSGQLAPGEWHVIEAYYDTNPVDGLTAKFSFLDAEYLEGTFQLGNSRGRGKSLFTLSSGKDTLYTRYPSTTRPRSSGSSSSNGKVRYDYDLLSCDSTAFALAGQTAIGFGRTPGSSTTFVLVSFTSDSVMTLTSPDGKSQIIYTYGVARPAHNPVLFSVNMQVQQKLGFFNPQAGDHVILHGDFNNWNGTMPVLVEGDIPGIYSYEIDFPGADVGKTFAYKFVILYGDGTMKGEAPPTRTFTLQARGQNLGIAYFDRKLRVDNVQNTAVAKQIYDEWSPASAYNEQWDQFLVVYSENATGETNLRGQLLNGEGQPYLYSFPICQAPGTQTKPAVAYNRQRNEYLVCWQDNRNGNMDIFAARLKADGTKITGPNTLGDSTFAVCDQDSAQYQPKVAHNYLQDTYLVVWTDYRMSQFTMMGVNNLDIYGQRVAGDGTLMATYGSGDSKVNFAITDQPYYSDMDPDVDFHGQIGPNTGEWLVVFSRGEKSSYYGPRIWGVRVKGSNGLLLNTFGEEILPAAALNKPAAGGPPWMPEFPIGFDGISLFGGGGAFVQGSPHVAANDDPARSSLKKSSAKPVFQNPECLVAWTDFRAGGDIYGQRVAYFPDSTAYKLLLKPERGSDSLHTLILLNRDGFWAVPFMMLIDWPNYAITNDPMYQCWNNLDYNPEEGTWLAVWNDWRNTPWDGAWGGSGFITPNADIYGQRLWIDPLDSALVWIDHEGTLNAPPELNTPIAFLEANEGCSNYPCIAYGATGNTFLVGYEFIEGSSSVDVMANLYNGIAPGGGTAIKQKAPTSTLHEFELMHNYPNPFNQATAIAYQLAASGRVRLAVYNIRGELVAVLFEGTRQAGTYTATWSGMDDLGRMLPSGVYFYRLSTPDLSKTQKMVLVR